MVIHDPREALKRSETNLFVQLCPDVTYYLKDYVSFNKIETCIDVYSLFRRRKGYFSVVST